MRGWEGNVEEEAFNHRWQRGDTSHEIKYLKNYFQNNDNIFTVFFSDHVAFNYYFELNICFVA